MKQLIVAFLFKLRAKFPKREELELLLRDFDLDFEHTVELAKKVGILDLSVKELFNRLSPDSREELVIKLFQVLYPSVIISKHPAKRVWLFKFGESKLFFDVMADTVMMPIGSEEPRVFPVAIFVENLPKLEGFLKYLGTYSRRNRRSFSKF